MENQNFQPDDGYRLIFGIFGYFHDFSIFDQNMLGAKFDTEFDFSVTFCLSARFSPISQRFFMPIRCFQLSCTGSTKCGNFY
jgi:hypothetical protein